MFLDRILKERTRIKTIYSNSNIIYSLKCEQCGEVISFTSDKNIEVDEFSSLCICGLCKYKEEIIEDNNIFSLSIFKNCYSYMYLEKRCFPDYKKKELLYFSLYKENRYTQFFWGI